MQGIKLMLVDDNIGLRRAMREYFAGESNIEVVCEAGDGQEALQLLEEYAPDIMLLDIIMPRLDGLGVLAALAKRENAPRVVMLTALKGDDVIARAMDLGAAYYMVKPVDMPSLRDRIMEVAGAAAPVIRTAAPQSTSYEKWSPEERVSNLFLSIGIPAHIKGYQYLREAVKMVMENHDVINRITKELYPGIARRYGTSASKVERAMRHAIEVAWNRGRLDNTNQLLGYNIFSQRDKPTNGEFIALVAQKAAGE